MYKFVSFTCYCVFLYNKELQVSHSLHTCNMFTADRAKGVVRTTECGQWNSRIAEQPSSGMAEYQKEGIEN